MKIRYFAHVIQSFLKPLLGLLVVASIAAATSVTAQTQANYLAGIQARGVIKIGVIADFPPYGLTNAANQPDGYDADVAKLLAQYLGVKLELIAVSGPNRIPFLLTDKVDVLVASLAITPERQKQVQFSRPYSAASMVLLGAKDVVISSPQDFKRYKIGVPRASTTDIGVSKIAPEGTDIRRFDDDASALQALMSRQIDAAGTSTVIAAQMQKRAPGKFQIKYTINEQVMGITLQHNRPELLDAVNAFIASRIGDKQLNTVFEKWIGSPLPQSVINPKP